METVDNDKSEIKRSLSSTLECLAELIYEWNQSAADGDRGPSNNAIALILYDDGSGKVCTYWGGFEGRGEHLNTQIQFDNVADGIDRLLDWIGE